MNRKRNLDRKNEISRRDAVLKRVFDLFFSFLGSIILLPLIIVLFLIATIDTKEMGFFLQQRVGKKGTLFKIFKIRTMNSSIREIDHTTASTLPAATRIGKVLRKYKLDELPQIYNVLLGQMSFVGPRPNFEEKYEALPEEEKEILYSVRPGITGPASIKYRDEEEILDKVKIFKDKVRINIKYVRDYSFLNDLKYIYRTLF